VTGSTRLNKNADCWALASAAEMASVMSKTKFVPASEAKEFWEKLAIPNTATPRSRQNRKRPSPQCLRQ
jgi:hypothetical protein